MGYRRLETSYFDVETHFQGGWALVAEQFPYAAELLGPSCWIAI